MPNQGNDKKGQAGGLRSRDNAKGSSDGSDHRRRDKSRRTATRQDDSDDPAMEEPTPTPPSTDSKIDSIMAMLSTQAQNEERRDQYLTKMVHSFEAKFTAYDARAAKVDVTLAKIIERLDASEKHPPLPAPGAPSGSSSSHGPAPAPAGSRSPPMTAPAAISETKIFFDGADYSLHRLVLGRYWNDLVKPMVLASLTAGSKPYIGDRDAFAVGFPSETAAQDFLAALNSKLGAPALIDPDNHSHKMVARMQRSKVPTKFGKRLSPVFQHYHRQLCALPGWMTEFKLVPDPHRGRIYIEKGERLIFLHTLDVDGASLKTHEEHLGEFNLDPAECRAAAKLFAPAA